MNNTAQEITFAQLLPTSVNALKGLLIIIVVMDHNDLLRLFAPDLFKPLTFHVLGFLVLPFLVPIKPIDRQYFRDRLIRYMVPFWWVLTLAAAMYAVLFRSGNELSAVALDWLAAATIGSAPLVKTSSGFFYLWFLPCLAGLIFFLTFYHSLVPRWQRVCSFVTLTCHLIITAFPQFLLTYVPFGLLIVAWTFPLGLLIRWAVKSSRVYRLRYVILAVFLSSYSYLVLIRLNLEIMTLELRAVSEPLLLLLQDISAVSGVLIALWVATQLGALKILSACGKHSLMVYLLHPLIFFLMYKVSGVSNWHLDKSQLLAAASVSVVLTVGVSLALAMGIAHQPIARAWLTPKDWKGWGPVQLMQRWAGRS